MFDHGVIEPDTAKWACPIVIESKKDGSFRFRVSFRLLNALTKRNTYSIPRMDAYIDSLGDDTVLSTLV